MDVEVEHGMVGFPRPIADCSEDGSGVSPSDSLLLSCSAVQTFTSVCEDLAEARNWYNF